jgi:hypothetical protein
MDAFRRGLGDTGYVEGENVAGCDEKASFPAADEQQADQTIACEPQGPTAEQDNIDANESAVFS